jgi:hypothetical protein
VAQTVKGRTGSFPGKMAELHIFLVQLTYAFLPAIFTLD